MQTVFFIASISAFIFGVASGYAYCIETYTPTVELFDSRLPDGEQAVKYYWDFNRNTKHMTVTIGKWRNEPREIKSQVIITYTPSTSTATNWPPTGEMAGGGGGGVTSKEEVDEIRKRATSSGTEP